MQSHGRMKSQSWVERDNQFLLEGFYMVNPLNGVGGKCRVAKFWRAIDGHCGISSKEIACYDDLCVRKIALAAAWQIRTWGSWTMRVLSEAEAKGMEAGARVEPC